MYIHKHRGFEKLLQFKYLTGKASGLEKILI